VEQLICDLPGGEDLGEVCVTVMLHLDHIGVDSVVPTQKLQHPRRRHRRPRATNHCHQTAIQGLLRLVYGGYVGDDSRLKEVPTWRACLGPAGGEGGDNGGGGSRGKGIA
jgi:hypothetical protein